MSNVIQFTHCIRVWGRGEGPALEAWFAVLVQCGEGVDYC